MLTGATIFSGFEGVGVGMRMAGITHAWGIEYDDQIAGVARANGFDVVTGDVLDVDPASLERVDVLHALPPCPNFSLAKTGGKETVHDIALARRVADYVRVLRPRYFTLENVWLYRNSQSWREIENALAELGYWGVVQKLDAADFGVPQNRIRMIARFALSEMVAPLTPTVARWTGWYEAIEDLIPSLPETQFAPWQLARLPDELVGSILLGGGNTNMADAATARRYDTVAELSPTVFASHTPGKTKAFIVHPTDQRSMPVMAQQEPIFTVVSNHGNGNMPRAFLVDGNNKGVDDSHKPTVRDASEPSITISVVKGTHRAWLSQGRVVKVTPRCLARFQSFPDGYELPEKSGLACKGIGNAVPPKLAQAIYAAMAAGGKG